MMIPAAGRGSTGGQAGGRPRGTDPLQRYGVRLLRVSRKRGLRRRTRSAIHSGSRQDQRSPTSSPGRRLRSHPGPRGLERIARVGRRRPTPRSSRRRRRNTMFSRDQIGRMHVQMCRTRHPLADGDSFDLHAREADDRTRRPRSSLMTIMHSSLTPATLRSSARFNRSCRGTICSSSLFAHR